MAKKYVGYGNLFCPNCGERREKGARVCPGCGMNYSLKISMKGVPALGAAGIGWTTYANDRTLKSHRKREKKGILISMGVISFIIAFAIIASTPGYLSTISEGSWIIVIGPLAIIWIFWFIWYKIQYSNSKGWEGDVVDKKIEEVEEKRKDNEGNYWTEHKTYYKVFFIDDKGKEHKLVQQDRSSWYEYLNVGDRVRYHGKNTSYYEKYDKSWEEYIPCAGCGSKSDARADYCPDCGTRLFKAPEPYYREKPEEDVDYEGRKKEKLYCQYCGTELDTDDYYCPECEAKNPYFKIGK